MSGIEDRQYQLGCWLNEERRDEGRNPDATEYDDDAEALKARQQVLERAGRFRAFAFFHWRGDWVEIDF